MITSLAYVTLRVPNPDAVAAYYNEVLGVLQVGPGLLSARPHGGVQVAHHEIELVEGEPGLERIGFSVDTLEGLPAGEMVQGELRVKGPDDWTFAFAPAGPGRLRRGGDAAFDLQRLGHLTLTSPDPAAAAAWCEKNLGFRLSERLGFEFIWLRCNRDHHGVAFTRGSRAGLHHLGWELGNWEAIQRACDHLCAQQQGVEYGPGRHGAGGNIFLYFVDPWGVRHELFTELVRIDDEETYVPVVKEPNKLASVNRWGPLPPPSFYTHIL